MYYLHLLRIFFYKNEDFKTLFSGNCSIYYLGFFQFGLKAVAPLSVAGYSVLQGFSVRYPDAWH